MTRPVVVIVTKVLDYQMRLLRGMLRTLSAQDVPLIAHTNGTSIGEPISPTIGRLLRTVDPIGVITMTAMREQEEQDLIGILSSVDVPIVGIGCHVPGATAVSGDNVAGMRALMAHLLDDCGVLRPALVRGIEHHVDSTVREQVFRQEMARRGLPVREELVVAGRFDAEHAHDAVAALLADGHELDAVVALNDSSALGAFTALEAAGLNVPRDVAVTGFDNSAESRCWPGFTTVDQALEEQGRLAASILLDQAAGGASPPDVEVPSRLVIRRTTLGLRRAGTDPSGTGMGGTGMGGPRSGRSGRGDRVDVPDLLEMTREGIELLAVQDAVLGMNRELTRCQTLDDITRELAARLDLLGAPRGFLTIREPSGEGRAVEDHVPGRLVLAYRGRRSWTAPGEVYDTAELLPQEYRSELDAGMLLFQPLSMLDRDLGFFLIEPAPGPAALTEATRVDLSRILDALFSTQALESDAADLERLVAQQTRDLEFEVSARRRAQEDLQRVNADLGIILATDALTRIGNRSAFDGCLARHWHDSEVRAAAGVDAVVGGTWLALLMIDIDYFKAYNDRYGHVQGDEALRTVAHCLEGSVREPTDLVCRYGGEEFAIVLPHSGIRAAIRVALRFQELLESEAVVHEGSDVATILTASIGAAAIRPTPESSGIDLVALADRALYDAKRTGRNRLVVQAPKE